ncbi:hypothetical protein IM511_02405 [Erythrobacteraceae bacterium E2-1 Yellow Sea]|nr:hypothetical protein [Erythrobacteraceae bacterium E2-1 Yellow Sea]
MVDFEGSKHGGFDVENGGEKEFDMNSNSLQDTPASASPGTRILAADANGVVVLPAGVSPEDISAQGRDIVITLADGSTIIIPDGAIIVPQMVIDGVAIPPQTVAALLNGADDINPEAEPGQLPSSGGEFDDGTSSLQDAFDLGDLLPYTELSREVVVEEEIIPFENEEPDVVIITPDNPVGVENAIATVDEDGLQGGIANNGTNDAVGDSTGILTNFSSFFSAGADAPLTYAFDPSAAGTLPTLYSGGVLVTYVVTATSITATAGGSPVFTFTILDPSTGAAQFTLQGPLDHPDTDDSENVVDITVDFGPLITAKDADGDIVTKAGSYNVVIDDDSPSFGANNATAPVLVTDDDDIPVTDSDGNDFSTLFTPLYGADGAADTNAITYAFVLLNDNGTNSGLVDTLTGDDILLRIVGNTVEGYLENDTGVVAFTLTLNADGTIDQEQARAIYHNDPTDPDELYDAVPADDASESIIADAIKLTATITDYDGDSVTSDPISIGDSFHFEDDGPTLGPIQDQQIDNDLTTNPATAVGTLHFEAGADGTGSAMTISADTTGITVGTLPVVTYQDGNVLYGYVDDGDNGTDVSAGNGVYDDTLDTLVFTLTVNPEAGSSGQYTFELITPLDPDVTDVPIGGATAFGAGPEEQGQALDDGGSTILSVVSGYNTTVSFDPVDWYDTGNVAPADLVTAGVNGSTSGWGIDNNNFNDGQFFVWDFGSDTLEDPDGPGGFIPPAVTMPDISFATFQFKGATGSESVQIVVHFVGGGYDAVTITGADLNTDANGPYTYTAPGGELISSIEMYGETLGGGGTKVELVSVGVQDESIDRTIDFSLTLTDGDGDSTTTEDFSVQIADGAVPDAPVAPIVLDLDGGGNEFVSASSNLAAYDYDGDGVKTKTAWIAAGSAILFHDTNGDGVVTDASEFVFGHDGMTDMEAVLKLYDSNNNGQLDQGDAEYGKFGVWMDDGDAQAEDGEFASLESMHITSIDLVSDGIQTVDGDGDVTIYGTSTFSIDGVVAGEASDAAFALGSDVDGAMMEALLAMSTQEGSDGSDPRTTDEVDVIVKDVLAEDVVDAMLNEITGDDGVQLADAGTLDAATLTHVIDGGAFVFDSSHTAVLDDQTAAELAAVHA